MGWRDTKVRKCTRHGNAQPCPKCKIVARQAAQTGNGPQKHHCGRIMRGGVCPNPHC